MIFFTSCNDDDMVSSTTEQSKVTLNKNKVTIFKLSKNDLTGRNFNNNYDYSGEFLNFTSVEAFDELYLSLKNQLDNHNNYINSLVENIDDEEELNLFFNENNINPNQPLIDFENSLNINSLRKKLETEEIEWLHTQSGDLNLDESPDNHRIADPILRTILNEDGEYMINGKIIRNTSWGQVKLEEPIADIYYRDYLTVEENTELVKFIPDDLGVGDININTCKSQSLYVKDYFFDNNTRRMRTRGQIYGLAGIDGRSYITATTKYYKKVAGLWFFRNAELHAEIDGVAFLSPAFNVCQASEQTYVYDIEQGRNHTITAGVYVTYSGGNSSDLYKISNDRMYGIHKVWNTNRKQVDIYDGQEH